jgi:hypothetical protein
VRTGAIALVLAWGCYHPSFEQNVPCAANLSCPGAQVCDTGHSPPVCVDQLGSDNGPGPDSNVQLDGAVTACGVCPDSTPVCDMDSTTCRGCYNDGECSSDVCIEYAGTCVPEPLALYVKNGGTDTGTCTRAQPCASISHALSLVDDTRFVIKVYDGNYHDAFLSSAQFVLSGEADGNNAHVFYKAIGNHDHLLEVDGGTSLVEEMILDGGNGETVRVQGQANVTMFQTEMLDSPNGTVDIVNASVDLEQVMIHDAMGTEAAIDINGGQLTLEQSVLYSIAGPCVRAAAKYLIENSFLVTCGAEGFLQAGAPIAGSVFHFNTVSSNGFGANCTGPVALEDTIFSGNGSASPQVNPPCVTAYSLFTDAAPPGTGNISNGNPAFVATDDDHITFQSAARDKADPAATLDFDFDGEQRPHGAVRDIGADEHY